MGLDRFLELEVAGGIRQREAVIRHGQVQASRLAEPPLPMRRPDRVHRRAGGEVERSLVALDVGIDLVAAGGDRQRQPLVAVLHEVGRATYGDAAPCRRAISRLDPVRTMPMTTIVRTTRKNGSLVRRYSPSSVALINSRMTTVVA